MQKKEINGNNRKTKGRRKKKKSEKKGKVEERQSEKKKSKRYIQCPTNNIALNALWPNLDTGRVRQFINIHQNSSHPPAEKKPGKRTKRWVYTGKHEQ